MIVDEMRATATAQSKRVPYLLRASQNILDLRLFVKLGDFVAMLLAGLVGYSIWQIINVSSPQFMFRSDIFFILFVISGFWILLASANEFYTPETLVERMRMLRKLVEITSQMLLLYALLFFFLPDKVIPRLPILYHGVAAGFIIPAWRILSLEVVIRTLKPCRALVIGTGQGLPYLISYLDNDIRKRMYRLVGIVSDEDVPQNYGIPSLGRLEDLPRLVAEHDIHELILASDKSYELKAAQVVVDQYIRGIHFVTLPSLFERLASRIPVDYIGTAWFSVLPTDGNSQFMRLYYMSVKNILDVGFAFAGLVIAFPVLLIASIFIKLDSRGPIIYSQERVGLYGRTFRMYKLRTMIADAEAKSGPVFAQPNDDRVTRVGRILRKSRIDELPQLVNILRGDMSLIGPRPERPEHAERLAEKIPFYNTRLVVRPGVTGWAQICYTYGVNDEDARKKLEYDLYYIRHASLALDWAIIIRTFFKIITLSGQ